MYHFLLARDEAPGFRPEGAMGLRVHLAPVLALLPVCTLLPLALTAASHSAWLPLCLGLACLVLGHAVFEVLRPRGSLAWFGLRLIASYAVCLALLLVTLHEDPDLIPVGSGTVSESVRALQPEPGGRGDAASKLSIVVPCANESAANVRRTVQAIWEATPELLEILLVDDASLPSLQHALGAELVHTSERRGGDGASSFLAEHRARVLRNREPWGLLRSKQRGADAAKGDAVVFLDCHVRPMEGWTQGLLEHLNADWRRVAVPLMTSLDPKTWQERQPATGGQKMCA